MLELELLLLPLTQSQAVLRRIAYLSPDCAFITFPILFKLTVASKKVKKNTSTQSVQINIMGSTLFSRPIPN